MESVLLEHMMPERTRIKFNIHYIISLPECYCIFPGIFPDYKVFVL